MLYVILKRYNLVLSILINNLANSYIVLYYKLIVLLNGTDLIKKKDTFQCSKLVFPKYF